MRKPLDADLRRARTVVRLAKNACDHICDEKPLNEPHQRLTVALFARAIRAADAAILLAVSGYPEDASVLIRTIYELLQHAAFINIKPAQRLQRTCDYLLEGVLDEIEDAEFAELWSKELGAPIVPDDRLRGIRTRLTREWESQAEKGFTDKTRTNNDTAGPAEESTEALTKQTRGVESAPRKRDDGCRMASPSICISSASNYQRLFSNNPRWRFLGSDKRIKALRQLWNNLDSSATTKGVMKAIDYCTRVLGNRHVHVAPLGLNNVITHQKGFAGRSEFSVTYKPCCDASAVRVLKAERVLMLAFSHTMALLFYHRDDPLRTNVARAMDSLNAAANPNAERTISKAEVQQRHRQKVDGIERRYRSIARMRR